MTWVLLPESATAVPRMARSLRSASLMSLTRAYRSPSTCRQMQRSIRTWAWPYRRQQVRSQTAPARCRRLVFALRVSAWPARPVYRPSARLACGSREMPTPWLMQATRRWLRAPSTSRTMRPSASRERLPSDARPSSRGRRGAMRSQRPTSARRRASRTAPTHRSKVRGQASPVRSAMRTRAPRKRRCR